ncbi:hypothetical protein B0H16DRAFT_383950 [Mycena metata]|uniref:Mixed lineage kinase domain-containing protein n=1 Tax=Mycena metata TaxID=1033252 RepID=A0AAD7MKG9_9AGAR|nr:hypothetical protein B0H16DRAFT_383950 [Mycena metata]
MSSGPKALAVGALSILQDLSNGSNIPALQPLVSLAVRIYTAAEGAKSNRKKAKVLAQEVCNSIEQIKHIYPAGSSSPGLYQDSIRDFQRVLEDVATFVDKIVQRNRFWRVVNQEEDRQELSDYRTKISEAKLQFLVAMEISKSRTLQREQIYPVFTLADLELRQTLNQANPKHTSAVARLVPHQKLVMLRQYHSKSTFDQDIESLMNTRICHLFAPAPFIVTELSIYSPVRDVVKGLYREPPRAFQGKVIQIIRGVLDGMNHLRDNDIELSDLIQLSGIQYDGSKVILNVELPKRKYRSTVASPLTNDPLEICAESIRDQGVLKNDYTLLAKSSKRSLHSKKAWIDIPGQENEVLQELFGLPEDPKGLGGLNPTTCPLASLAVPHGM